MPLISLKQLLDHAAEYQYGLPAFNINNMEQGISIMDAANKVNAPVIIQASRGARLYANDKYPLKGSNTCCQGLVDIGFLITTFLFFDQDLIQSGTKR